MKIVLVTSLFSGFRESVRSGLWDPTGSPTIYKLINKLDASEHALNIFFVDKEYLIKNKVEHIKLSGLRSPVTIIKSFKDKKILSSYFELLSDIVLFINLLFIISKENADIIYFDRAHVVVAGLFSRLTNKKVVLRLMGINPVLKSIYRSKWHPCLFVKKVFLKSNFSAVICTQDGSGGEQWLDKLLNQNVPKYLLINGVDKGFKTREITSSGSDGHKKINILFLGRLESGKGIDNFITFIDKLSENINCTLLSVTIVGDGSKKPWLQEQLNRFKKIEVNYISSVPHNEIDKVYRDSDIYVSFNDMGNLSNSNLEALSSGCCVFVPESDKYNNRDITSENLFPDSIMPRYKNLDELVLKVKCLIEDKDKLNDVKNITFKYSNKKIPHWDDRIKYEQDLLNNIALGKSSNTNYLASIKHNY